MNPTTTQHPRDGAPLRHRHRRRGSFAAVAVASTLILAGCAGEPQIVRDRRDAIVGAVASASPEDLVLVAGKGHETGQIFGDTVVPFDDREVVRDALAARSGGAA